MRMSLRHSWISQLAGEVGSLVGWLTGNVEMEVERERETMGGNGWGRRIGESATRNLWDECVGWMSKHYTV